ncbi:penicillin-binding protein 2 [Frigidibacter sp. MR17.24]|uniref:penicillin-binding protein 2 n=1 Tax=Frigidibacter sp. MR17.24 TaxID=3127345 RepID=UPI003012C4BE
MRRSPKDTAESSRKITRRALVLGASQAAVVAVLGFRMHHMQVDEADDFKLLAEENRINMRLIPPARGLINDRNGNLLAGNEQNYRVVITREDAGDVEDVLHRLAQLIPLTAEDIERTLHESERRSAFVPITVADRLSWEDFSRVAVNAPALPGVTPEVGQSRFYPYAGDFAHALGYVGPVSDYDLSKMEDPDPLLQIPKFQIGKVGIESKMEDVLRGEAGTKRIEVNAVGRVMRELDRVDGKQGSRVQLTLDLGLQNYMQQRLGSESASAVCMHCETGDVLGIVSAPSFDPNLFVRGISSADYSQLMNHDHRPLADKSVQGTYPPGSTFKMVVALAALEAGVMTTQDTVYCPGYMQLGTRRFHCWSRGGHGSLNLTGALMHSCDIYFYEAAQRVGIEKISEMGQKLGLGIRHDLPLSAVAEGLMPTKAWKQERYGRDWQVGDSVNAGIGQGYILASPLQLAVMTARISTGRAIEPRLIRSIDGVEPPAAEPASLGLQEAFLRAARKGMHDVVNLRGGTGYGIRCVDDAMMIAGKSGTSQVRNITAAERAAGVISNDQLPWNRRDHALFVGFAPFDAPKVACSVVVEHGAGGSSVAGPIVRDILMQALSGGLPPLSAYPANQRDKVEAQRAKMNLLDPRLTAAAPPTRA